MERHRILEVAGCVAAMVLAVSQSPRGRVEGAPVAQKIVLQAQLAAMVAMGL